MKRERPRLLFDGRDYELVEVVNESVASDRESLPEQPRKLFDAALHPRGIKELAASRERRIASAVIHLLDSLEVGDAEDRLVALRALKDEVLHCGQASMARNTARVLLEIMKQLVRERQNPRRQVELAHEFFAAVSGRPAIIRRELRKYHLLEMSEDWNQVAFDHHVHDANTKGRKAPTHLIMDAWIKGIRELTVVYYNFMNREAVSELVEAAEIMGIKVRAGVEVAALFRGKYVQFIWEPHGFEGPKDFLEFLDEPPVQAFFEEGRAVARRQTRSVLALLCCFNEKHLPELNETYGLSLPPLEEQEFLEFVGRGQPSVAHLADFIHQQCLTEAQAQITELRARPSEGARRERSSAAIDRLNHLLPEVIVRDYLAWDQNAELPEPRIPVEGDDVPPLLKLSPPHVLDWLIALRPGSRITLNPSNLSHADVLEVLYDGEGAVTHLEIFNLKDYKRARNPYVRQIGLIRRTLNGGSLIACKQLIREIIADVEASDAPDREDRLEKLEVVLRGIHGLSSHYSRLPLRSRIGSDSTGRLRSYFGMGLAVRDTLLPRAQAEFARRPGTGEVIPVSTQALLTTTWLPRESHLSALEALFRGLRRTPGLRGLGYRRENSYVVPPNVTRIAERGNVLTLGGVEEHPTNGLSLTEAVEGGGLRWRDLNTPLKKILKVLIGFVPAFLTFALTKDWWVLAYLGAVIWFAITGVRNVVQAIVGGGGIIRSHLLRWKDLVSWERICDSLLYTGFSVPLLDWLVKGQLLDRGLGVTTSTSPLILYTVMALANGIYLFSHNTFRGLPRAAAVGNLFRSILSIPVALAFNIILFELLRATGSDPAGANGMLQLWAAVIGKAASDVVAGFIEGAADRAANLRARDEDYRAKITRLLEVHGRFELLFPDRDVLEMLGAPEEFSKAVPLPLDGGEPAFKELWRRQVINALDLMYFWMYQPRARVVFRRLLSQITVEERQIILATQRLLECRRAISELFLDDLVGASFSAPLAFYLDKSPAYLRDMKRLSEQEGRASKPPVRAAA